MLEPRRPFDPIATALAAALREIAERRRAEELDRRAKMTVVRGGKEEPAA
jgi:hypothetical protein